MDLGIIGTSPTTELYTRTWWCVTTAIVPDTDISSGRTVKSKTSLSRLTTGIDLPTADGKLENPMHGLAIDPFVFDVPGGIGTGDEIAPTVRISNEDSSLLAGVLCQVFRIRPSLLNSSSC
jgi:hypothetical protein